MKEEYEEDFSSTAGQFEEFLNSTVWIDIKSELSVWLEGVRDGLESTDSDEKELYRNQGRAQGIRYLLSLPETIRDQLVALQEQAQNKEEEEETIDG